MNLIISYIPKNRKKNIDLTPEKLRKNVLAKDNFSINNFCTETTITSFTKRTKVDFEENVVTNLAKRFGFFDIIKT